MAVELISSRCHFQPKEVKIHVSNFNDFISNVVQGNYDFLCDFFKEVESLTIYGEKEIEWIKVIRGANTATLSAENASKLLGFILSNPNPKLVSLSITIYKT